ncbi:porin family protein [Prevotella aurantiaca]|jgi:hypothetical protein|uniref:porin family protein n=1 Tax=Prevotella aurantiaca TaxID=596085 RepID=UPI0023F2F4C2
MHRKIIFALLITLSLCAYAQVGDYRNNLSIGCNVGYSLSNVGFNPKVSQSMNGGINAGLSIKYVCEKYFSTICSIYGEINYVSMGWKQNIRTSKNELVTNTNGTIEEYSRTLNYLQIPIFAHLAWGREHSGFNFFVQAGPQIGILLNETTKKNYETPNLSRDGTGRSNTVIQQESMPADNKFDYGIAAGLGTEWTIPHVGHFLIEARYYYGLGNIYRNSKKDFFGKSNNSNIVVKATYLFDITKSKNNNKIN